jgi:double-strand break repair protein MRE11
MSDAGQDSTFRILLATDNHLGYMERDPIRGEDSFKSFEEIFQIAHAKNVFFIPSPTVPPLNFYIPERPI